MTPQQIIAHCRSMEWIFSGADGELAELKNFLVYLVMVLDEVRLADGGRLNDQTDFKLFLNELARAAKPEEATGAGR